jgi:hypothetical protein
MNRKNARFRYAASLLLLLFAGATSSALAQGTAFSYQGRLQDSGANANSNYDFQFTLWDALNGGTQQPQPTPVTVTKSGVAVANGVFTVHLDFGATSFPGADRWLETSVRLAGGGAFTVLSPRQPITSTPYAVRSASSSSSDLATTATNATQLGGVAANQYVVTTDSRMSDPRAPTAGSANYLQNTISQQASSNFNISGNGVIGASLAIGTTTPASRFMVAQSTAGTGSVSIVASSTTVSGTNTQFTTFFQVGDTIAVAGTAARTITAISSNTSLVVSSAFSTTANGLPYTLFNGTSLLVTVDGKVGIGTASPSYKFHVLVQNDSTAAGNFQSNSPAGFSNGLLVTAGTNANDVSFWSRDQAGNSLFVVRGDGNVGIGTTNLNAAKLHVVSSIQGVDAVFGSGAVNSVGVHGAGFPGVVGEGLNGGPGVQGSGNYGVTGFGNTGVFGQGSATGVLGQGNATGATGVKGDATFGSVGVMGLVGSTSGNFGLDYIGKAAVWGTSASSVGVFGTSDTNVGVVGVSQNNIGVLGRSITGNAGQFEGTVVVTTLASGGGSAVCRNNSNQLSSCSSSSLRYKKDISRFGSGLDVINRLKPIAFTWKLDGTRDFGLGAEDVEKVDPNLVFYRDGKIEGVKYDRIGVVLINAVKEQQAQIEQQKKALEHQQELIKQQTEQVRQQSTMVTAQQQQIEALKKLVCRSHRRAVVCR